MRFLQHPTARRNDQPRLLGERDGPAGDEAASGCRQRTRASSFDPSVARLDHRLVVQDELAVVDGAEIGLEAPGAAGRCRASRVRTPGSGPSRLPWPCTSPVGVPRLLGALAVPPVSRRRDADRRADEEDLALEVERSLERREDRSPQQRRRRRRRRPRAGSRTRPLRGEQRCPPAGRVLQALADLAEHPVTGGVTERVVDRLEVVQVHEQDGDREVVARLPLDHVLDAVLEQRPVRRPVTASWKAWCWAAPRTPCVRTRHGC